MAQFQPTRWFISFIGTGFLLAAMVVIGCGEGEPEFGGERPDGVVEHPVADSIPHLDRDHVPIDGSTTLDEVDEPPEAVEALAAYLNDENETEPRELDLVVGDEQYFDVISPGAGRLLIAEGGFSHRLVEYHLETDEAKTLAEQGEGPGDVLNPRGLAREEDSVYMISGHEMISLFDCEAFPCALKETRRFEGLWAESLAPVGSAVAALSVPESGDPEEAHAARMLDLEEGAVLDAFGAAYVSENPLVREEFMIGSSIRHLDGPERYVVAYPMLPFLYIYDEGGVLRATYRVEEDFKQYYVRTGGEHGQSIAMKPEGSDRLSRVEVVGDETVVLEVTAIRDIEREDLNGTVSASATHENRYYGVDVGARESYYIGSIAYERSAAGTIIPTREGLVLNEAGELSLVAD